MTGQIATNLNNRARRRHRRRFWTSIPEDEDDYECPSCGRGRDVVTRWEIHHRNGDYFDGRLLNLVAVCHSCHRKLHRQQDIRERLREMREEAASLGIPQTNIRFMGGGTA